MPTVSDIRRVFRDHVRFTGDGQPNAPVGAPLPVGDPRSGMYNLDKYEIRELLIAILQTQGDAGALQTIITQLDAKADLANRGAIFGSRAQAVAAGQANLPPALGRIFTLEESAGTQALVIRTPGTAQSPDPLFPTAPFWSVDVSINVGAEAAARIEGLAQEAAARQEAIAAEAARAMAAERELALIPPASGWVRALGRGEVDPSGPYAAIYAEGHRVGAWDANGNPLLTFGRILGRGEADAGKAVLTLISQDGFEIPQGGGSAPAPTPDPVPDDPIYNIQARPGVFNSLADLLGYYEELRAEFPEYISRSSLGQDALGNDLWCYEFRPRQKRPVNKPEQPEDNRGHGITQQPRIVIQGGIHGWEETAHKGLLLFCRTLCRRWKYYPEYEELRFGAILNVIPAANPTGVNQRTRGNHNGVDLNRNFNWRWNDVLPNEGNIYWKGPSAASEAETRILQRLPLTFPDAVGIADIHAHSETHVFWLGTRPDAALGFSLQALDRMVAWSRKEIFDCGDAQLMAQITAGEFGMGHSYYSEVGGKLSVLCEATNDAEHPAFGTNGGIRSQAKAAERVVLEVVRSMLHREQQRRIINQNQGQAPVPVQP